MEKFIINRYTSLDTIAEYIKTHTGIDIKHFGVWLKIKDLKEIRNVIAHNERVRESKINTFKSIANRNNQHITFIEESKFLIIKKSYLDEVINTSHKFLDEILSEIWKKKEISR